MRGPNTLRLIVISFGKRSCLETSKLSLLTQMISQQIQFTGPIIDYICNKLDTYDLYAPAWGECQILFRYCLILLRYCQILLITISNNIFYLLYLFSVTFFSCTSLYYKQITLCVIYTQGRLISNLIFFNLKNIN